jgi:hypothetical protein
MAFTQLTTDLNIISALDDEPNDNTGLTAAQLKAKFDEGGNDIKTFINGTLISELDALAAAAVKFTPPSTMNATNVQTALTEIETALQDSTAGYTNSISTTTINTTWTNA